MNKQGIELEKAGINEYRYLGCIIARYEHGRTKRWSVEKEGEELAFNLYTQTSAIDYIQQVGQHK